MMLTLLAMDHTLSCKNTEEKTLAFEGNRPILNPNSYVYIRVALSELPLLLDPQFTAFEKKMDKVHIIRLL